MNILEACKAYVHYTSVPHSYNIGFSGNDETQLDAKDGYELACLFRELCDELNTTEDSVDYIVDKGVSEEYYEMEDFYDWGHHGILAEDDCLYSNTYEILDKALKSGKYFDSGFHGFKHELQSMRVQRNEHGIVVEVFAECDEMPDLIYDCDGAENLTEEQIENIESVYDDDYEHFTEETEHFWLPSNASILDILTEAEKVANGIEEDLKETYRFVQELVKEQFIIEENGDNNN